MNFAEFLRTCILKSTCQRLQNLIMTSFPLTWKHRFLNNKLLRARSSIINF